MYNLFYKDFANKRYNTPYIRKLIKIDPVVSSIESPYYV